MAKRSSFGPLVLVMAALSCSFYVACGDDDVVIVQAGRMAPLKGHVVLLDALAGLRGNPRWVCWQIGGPQRSDEGRYAGDLERQARRLGIAERVRFLGARSDVASLLAAADLYCQPNVQPETFGLTFVEALAAGLPVVTSDLGAAREIVDGRCGLLVPACDSRALAASLEILVDDDRRRRQLGAAGPERAEALCDPRRQLTRLAQALAAVAHGHASLC